MLGLTRNISASFFERGIRCNCIEPANILTEINKVPREKGIGILEWQMRAGKAAPLHTITKPGEKKPMLGKPKDCANAIAYLADDVARALHLRRGAEGRRRLAEYVTCTQRRQNDVYTV